MILLEFNETPSSFNRAGARGSWWTFATAKKKWQRDIGWALIASGAKRPLPSPCSVHAVLRFPQRRRRDEGNFKVLLEKACGDALTEGSWLPDDTPEHYRFTRVEFEEERGPARTRIVIAEGAGHRNGKVP